MAKMLRMQFDLYKYWEKKIFETEPDFGADSLFPCEIVDIFTSVEGKVESSMKETAIFMEIGNLFKSISKSIKLQPLIQDD